MLHGILRLFFPPRCLACRTLLPFATTGECALCAKCASQWQQSLHAQCKSCFLPYFDCRCVNSRLEKAGVISHVKLAPYDETGGGHGTVRRMILKMKQFDHKKRFDFVAKELSLGVRQAVEAAEHERQSKASSALTTVIVYLPRAAHNMMESGVDQARQLALALARATGFPVKRAIVRRRDRISQKQLSRSARAKNVRDVFFVKGDVEGVRVLLLDDVVTTGATMSEAARLLREAGAAEVIAVSVALTVGEKA